MEPSLFNNSNNQTIVNSQLLVAQSKPVEQSKDETVQKTENVVASLWDLFLVLATPIRLLIRLIKWLVADEKNSSEQEKKATKINEIGTEILKVSQSNKVDENATRVTEVQIPVGLKTSQDQVGDQEDQGTDSEEEKTSQIDEIKQLQNDNAQTFQQKEVEHQDPKGDLFNSWINLPAKPPVAQGSTFQMIKNIIDQRLKKMADEPGNKKAASGTKVDLHYRGENYLDKAMLQSEEDSVQVSNSKAKVIEFLKHKNLETAEVSFARNPVLEDITIPEKLREEINQFKIPEQFQRDLNRCLSVLNGKIVFDPNSSGSPKDRILDCYDTLKNFRQTYGEQVFSNMCNLFTQGMFDPLLRKVSAMVGEGYEANIAKPTTNLFYSLEDEGENFRLRIGAFFGFVNAQEAEVIAYMGVGQEIVISKEDMNKDWTKTEESPSLFLQEYYTKYCDTKTKAWQELQKRFDPPHGWLSYIVSFVK